MRAQGRGAHQACSTAGAGTRVVRGGRERRQAERGALHEQEQQRTNHVAALKAWYIDSKNVDPSWVLDGFAAPQCYDKLVEVGCATRSTTASPSGARRRAPPAVDARAGRGIGGAAAQCVQVEVARVALAELAQTQAVVDLLATNAADVAAHGACPWECCSSKRLAVVSSATLVYNSLPTKLTAASIRSGARWLARQEIDREPSEQVQSGNHMLLSLPR